jgi:hypothetical protein
MKNNYANLTMTTEEFNHLVELNKKRNGAYFTIQYYTDCNKQVSAAFKGHNVTKLTTMSVRKGVDYNNLKAVKLKRAEKPQEESIQRKCWYFHIDKMLLQHKEKPNTYYVALFPNPLTKARTMYMFNGIVVSKEKLKEMGVMQPSFWKEKEKPLMITLGLDKIVNVY